MEWKLLATGFENYTNYIKLPQSILVEFNQPEKFNDYDWTGQTQHRNSRKRKGVNLINQTKVPTARINPPYYFCIESSIGIYSYCGVQDFTAEEGMVIIPNHILDQMLIQGSDFVTIRLINDIPKGKFVLIEPLDKNIFNIPDLDKYLEKVLSGYCLLYQNQIINFEYDYQVYRILIKEIKSVDDKETNYIDIVNTDLSIDIHNKFLEEELIEKARQEKIRKEQELKFKEEQELKAKEEQKKLAEMKTNGSQYFIGEGNKLGGETINDPVLMRELRLQKFLEQSNQQKELHTMKQMEKSIMDLAIWESQPDQKLKTNPNQNQNQITTKKQEPQKKTKEFDL